MKQFTPLVMLAFLATSASAAVLILSSNGTYTQKASLSAAATAPDVSGKLIVVTSPQTVTTGVHLHSDRAMWVMPGGSIVASGVGFANISSPTVNYGPAFSTGVTVYGNAGNYYGNAGNAGLLNGQTAYYWQNNAINSIKFNNHSSNYYLNASNLNAGVVPDAQLPLTTGWGTNKLLKTDSRYGFTGFVNATTITVAASSITLSGLNLAANGQQYEVMFTGARATVGAPALQCNINNDTGASNYSWLGEDGIGANTSSYLALGFACDLSIQNNYILWAFPGNQWSIAGKFSGITSAYAVYLGDAAGAWKSAANITSLKFSTADSSNFAAGTRIIVRQLN